MKDSTFYSEMCYLIVSIIHLAQLQRVLKVFFKKINTSKDSILFKEKLHCKLPTVVLTEHVYTKLKIFKSAL